MNPNLFLFLSLHFIEFSNPIHSPFLLVRASEIFVNVQMIFFFSFSSQVNISITITCRFISFASLLRSLIEREYRSLSFPLYSGQKICRTSSLTSLLSNKYRFPFQIVPNVFPIFSPGLVNLLILINLLWDTCTNSPLNLVFFVPVHYTALSDYDWISIVIV